MLKIFLYSFFQGTEAIERFSPLLTKYWQQPISSCGALHHNQKVTGGKNQFHGYY